MEEEIWNVIPSKDVKEHIEGSYCECNPNVNVMSNGNVVITHNSFDGREVIEWVNEILIR